MSWLRRLAIVIGLAAVLFVTYFVPRPRRVLAWIGRRRRAGRAA